jgi:hypothetical protein
MASPGDISVEQYAGISAAIADQFPLAEILANEEIPPARWPDVDMAWKLQLVEDPATFAAYRVKLGEAEDFLHRKVTPLEDDLPAWLGFLGAYSAHKAPFELLGGMGLRMNDMARLQRRWSKRMAEDAELSKQAAELARKKPDRPAQVTAESIELKPFPWSKRKGSPEPKPDATLNAEAKEAPRLPSSFAPWRDLAAPLPSSFAPHPDLAPPAPSFMFAPHPDLAPAPKPKLAGTALALDVPRGPALPFVEGEAPKAIAEGTGDPRPSGSLGGTALALDVPRGPAMPFARSATAPAPEANLPKIAPAPSKLAGTALALDVPRGPAMPFVEGEAPDKIAHASPEEPKIKRPPEKLGGTSLAVDVPKGPALPFAKSASPQANDPKRKKLGDLSFGIAIPKNLPPARAAAKAAAEPSKAAEPSLTLEQHASLCVELAVSPERAAETLQRYRISAEQKAHLDAHYRQKVAESPDARAAWDRAYQAYHAWLARSRGAPR